MIIRFRRTLGMLVVICAMLLCPVLLSAQATGATDINDITAQIVKARDLTAGYVSLANSSFGKTSPEHVTAQKLYIAAYSDNTAWNAYVVSALKAGHAKHLNSDELYQQRATKALGSATAFVSYVDTATHGESKAVITLLSSLADLGIKLWTNISDQIRKNRLAAATDFQDATKWKSWDELTASAPTTGGSGTPHN